MSAFHTEFTINIPWALGSCVISGDRMFVK